MNPDTLRVVELAIDLVSTAATVGITFVLYLLTRYVARGESVRSINEGWAYFNQKMLDDDNVKVMNDFLKSDSSFRLHEDQRINYVLFLMINNLSSQYYNTRSKILKEKFSMDSIDDYIRFLWPRLDYVVELLRQRGYDDEFIDFFVTRAETLRAEQRVE